MFLFNHILRSAMLLTLSFSALLSAVESENSETALTKSKSKNHCPSTFPQYYFYYDDSSGQEKEKNLYLNCTNLAWSVCDEGDRMVANCTNPENGNHCSLFYYTNNSDSDCSFDISCSNCSESLSCDDYSNPLSSCIAYLVEDCPTSLNFFKYSDLKWIGCYNGTAIGNLLSPKINKTCLVIVHNYNKPSNPTYQGNIYCDGRCEGRAIV